MEPTEKRTVMAIVERNEGKYTPKCLHELFFEAHVLYADMQKLRLCARKLRTVACQRRALGATWPQKWWQRSLRSCR